MNTQYDQALQQAIIRRLMRQSLQSDLFIPRLGRTEVQAMVDVAITAEVKHQDRPLSKSDHRRLFDAIVAEPASLLAVPYWLVLLLAQDETDEIIIVGPYQVIIRKQDELISTNSRFADDLHLLYILNLLLGHTDQRLNAQTPAVYVRLSNQSAIMALMPPATETTVASIRINQDRAE